MSKLKTTGCCDSKHVSDKIKNRNSRYLPFKHRTCVNEGLFQMIHKIFTVMNQDFTKFASDH